MRCQDDAASDRNRAARAPRAARARRDGDTVLFANRKHSGDVVTPFGIDDNVRKAPDGFTFVVRVGGKACLRGVDFGWAKRAIELNERTLDGITRGDSDFRGRDEHDVLTS
jgi:hypothetical protein